LSAGFLLSERMVSVFPQNEHHQLSERASLVISLLQRLQIIEKFLKREKKCKVNQKFLII